MPSMLVQSTSSALIATSRTKFQGFRRSLATRNQPATSTPPATTPVHAYAHHNKKASQISVVALPFEPRPSKFTPPSRTWRFLKPVPAALPRLSSWSRSLHTQIPPPSLPKLLPPTLPARSIQRERLLPAPLSIRKDSVQLGVRTSYHTIREESTTGTEIMTKCVYVPWLIHGDSAESAEWNAFLSNSVGHYHCKDLH